MILHTTRKFGTAKPTASVTHTRTDGRTENKYLDNPHYNLQAFPGTVTSGNVTVPTTEIRYNVQLTASILVGAEINEGMLSPATNIFVPDVGEGLYLYVFMFVINVVPK